MNCACGDTARFFVGRDGKPGFCCPHHRCKFFALTPIQCDGYHRIMPNAQTPPETVIIRFEAIAHPESTGDTPTMAVLATFQGNLYGRPEVSSVLHDPQFEGVWYPAREGYVFIDTFYPKLVTSLRRVQHVLVEEIPSFFFRCVTRMQQVVAQHASAVAAGKALGVDSDDAVYTQLRSFQRHGVEFVVAHGGRGMIADDMGLGKTVQAIAIAHLYREEWPVLVLCPMSLMENWVKEFNKFAGVPYSRMVVLQSNKARVTDLHDVVVVSYSSLKCLDNVSFNVVIADESHYIKTGETKRTQQALRLCRSAKRVVLLSGTPAMARPLELYTQLQALQPTIVPTKTQYGARYCNSHVSRFGVDATGHSHTDELSLLLRHFMIRRTKQALGAELPSKTRQLLYVFITDKEKKALEKQVMALRRSIVSHPDGLGSNAGGDYTSRAPNAFELKIATAQAKIPAVRDYVLSTVEQHLDAGEKVIFFAHHQCMMEALRSAVEAVRPKQPIDYIFIAGDTPGPQREQLANHFRTAPSCGVAVLSMQSSGTGHNFTCASTVVFAELDWNPSTHLQCEDRVHRIGQANPCSIKYLLAEGTSDSVIWPMLQAKLSVTTAMFAATGAETDTAGGEGAGVYQLSANADQQKVARRDLSETADGTQGTLDGFLRPSQRSSTSTPSAKPRTPLCPGDEDDNSVMCVDETNNNGKSTPAGAESIVSPRMPMLTPPSRTPLHAAVHPSPPPVAPPVAQRPRVVIPIELYEQQRLAKAPAATTARVHSTATATTSVSASAPHKPVEAKTSVLDLMRTSPVTHADVSPPAKPVGTVPSAPTRASRPMVMHIGGGTASAGESPSCTESTVVYTNHSTAQAVSRGGAGLPSAVLGAPRTRTTFSFSKGPEQPTAAPPTAAAATTVARVAIPIGFKRRGPDASPPASPSPSVVRGPRLEGLPVATGPGPASPPAAPPPPAETPPTPATPAIIFDPANLSVSAPTKPRTTFVFRTQKPSTP